MWFFISFLIDVNTFFRFLSLPATECLVFQLKIDIVKSTFFKCFENDYKHINLLKKLMQTSINKKKLTIRSALFMHATKCRFILRYQFSIIASVTFFAWVNLFHSFSHRVDYVSTGTLFTFLTRSTSTHRPQSSFLMRTAFSEHISLPSSRCFVVIVCNNDLRCMSWLMSWLLATTK